ncbi:MAG: hypothetical protein C0594_16360, partial [Marinilabiliales bacterium]
MKKLLITLLFSSVFFSSCMKNKLTPEWDTNLLTPIMRGYMNFSNLIEDSIKNIDNDQLIYLVYHDLLYAASIDSLVQIPDTSVDYSAKLSNIDLGTIEFNYKTSLGDIAENDREENGPTGGLYEQIMTAHNTGQPTTIDPISTQSYPDIEIDADNYFQTLTIESATIEVIIDNQLPMPVSDLAFEIRNESNNELILQDTFLIVNPGETESSLNNISNQTIEGLLKGNINIASPGISIPVTIDTSDALTATIRIYDITVSEATAIFPNQDIITMNETAVFS